MPLLNLNDLKARIKSGNPEGWYLFAGEEDYLKNFYSSEIIKLASGDDAFDVFNRAEWSSDEMNFAELAEAIETPPMMSDYKLVIWRFADFGSCKEKELSVFEKEILPLRREFPYTVFVIVATPEGFDAGTEKRPSKLMRILSSAFDVMLFPKSTDTQLLSWLKKHFDREGIAVTLEALNTMLGQVGHSMEILKNEVEKLAAYLHANSLTQLTPEIVELVSTSNIENDSFALKNAVYDGDTKRALRVLAELKFKRTEPQIIVGMLSKIYSELSAVSMLSSEGESFDGIQKLLGIGSYPLQLAMKAVKRHGAEKINTALKSLLVTDASAKFGGIAGYQAIELFIVKNL